MQEKGIFLTKDAQRKVRFWSTDVLRLAHANMRICQFSVAQFGSSDMAAAEAVRTQPNVYEFILAVNMWLRQLHVHISFYKWFRQMTNSTSNASSRELTAAMERADDGDELSRLKLDLSVEDRLKHEILVHEKALVGAKLASDKLRLWLRNQNWFKKNRVTADQIKAALADLQKAGLLDVEMDPEAAASPPVSGAEAKSKAKSKAKGPKPVVYVKRSAREIVDNAEAEALRKRLLVPIKCF